MTFSQYFIPFYKDAGRVKKLSVTPEQLKSRLETLNPGTTAQVTDLTGTMDHYQAVIVSPAFEGKLMIEQHRMVMALVRSEVDSGEVHALTLKTYTPKQFETEQYKKRI